MTIADQLPLALQTALAESGARTGKFCLAYSGGLDSTVLLHAFVQAKLPYPLRAIYVDHGLHPESAMWAEHCARVAEAQGVPFSSTRITLERTSGESLEAIAREARYAALREALQPDECLLTAHHARDQLETVLLALLRGAGVAGLAAMPAYSAHHGMPVLRPLLGLGADELRLYALECKLSWIEDPSNQSSDFDRNYLRHNVVPLLEQRWPAAAETISRSARLSGSAAGLLDELGGLDTTGALKANILNIECLQGLSSQRQSNALRYVIRHLGLPIPSEVQLHAALAGLLMARNDANPVAAWPGARVRRYQGRLWFFSVADDPGSLKPQEDAFQWDTSVALDLGGLRGRLTLVPKKGGRLALNACRGFLTVRFRTGGEKLRPDVGARNRDLKKLLQEHSVVPWMREHIPLIYAEERLLAAGDLWVNQDYAATSSEPGAELVWSAHGMLG